MTVSYHYSPVLKRWAECSNPANCRFRESNHYPKNTVDLLDSAGGISRAKNTATIDITVYKKGQGTHPKQIKVAPEGFSSLYCSKCGRYYSKAYAKRLSDTNKEIKCEYADCTQAQILEKTGVDLRFEDAKFLDSNEVLSSHWYHATNVRHWLQKLQETGEGNPHSTILAHVGTKNAALERTRDVVKWNSTLRDSEYYLYELRFKLNAKVSPFVFNDADTDWPETLGRTSGTPYSPNQANRYVNEFEAAGGMSLLANPNMFEVVKVSSIQFS